MSSRRLRHGSRVCARPGWRAFVAYAAPWADRPRLALAETPQLQLSSGDSRSREYGAVRSANVAELVFLAFHRSGELDKRYVEPVGDLADGAPRWIRLPLLDP